MTLDPKILAELREKLTQEKTRVEEELNRIGKPTTTSGDFSTNFSEIGTDEDDNASEVEEYTDNLAIETTLEKQLKEIIEALDRMDAGTYGQCKNCGTDIPVERLRAYPSAKKCLSC